MLSDVQRAILNRSPAAVSMEQLIQLYDALYPRAALDFVHQNDLRAALAIIDAQMLILKGLITAHTHLSAAPGSPTGPGVGGAAAVVGGVAAQLNPAYALSLIVPGGQPTGGAVAIYPKRVNAVAFAQPPLNPLLFA